jgi:hypothetical protein
MSHFRNFSQNTVVLEPSLTLLALFGSNLTLLGLVVDLSPFLPVIRPISAQAKLILNMSESRQQVSAAQQGLIRCQLQGWSEKIPQMREVFYELMLRLFFLKFLGGGDIRSPPLHVEVRLLHSEALKERIGNKMS